jgi:hypothetical protein
MLNERYLDSNKLKTLIANTITEKSLESQLKSPAMLAAKLTTKRNIAFYRSARTTFSDNNLSDNQRML